MSDGTHRRTRVVVRFIAAPAPAVWAAGAGAVDSPLTSPPQPLIQSLSETTCVLRKSGNGQLFLAA